MYDVGKKTKLKCSISVENLKSHLMFITTVSSQIKFILITI